MKLHKKTPWQLAWLNLINSLGNLRTFTCKIYHKRAGFFENWKDLTFMQKMTWCFDMGKLRNLQKVEQGCALDSVHRSASCAYAYPQLLSPVFLNYVTQFPAVLFSPQEGKNREMNAASFVVCYFGRYLRLSLQLILFKLFFHANVCSLPNFGHFFAMPSQNKTKNMCQCHCVGLLPKCPNCP